MSQNKKKLSPCKSGLYGSIGRFTVGLNFARTWSWGEEVKGAFRTHLVTTFISRNYYPDGRVARRINVILGPIIFIVGWMSK